MGYGLRHGVVVAVLSVLGAGCTTQTWTNKLFAKQLAEVDERFVAVDARAQQHGERLGRAEARLDDLETGVHEHADRLDRVDERVVHVDTETRRQGERLDRMDVHVTQLDTGLRETRSLLRGALAQTPSTSIRSAAPDRRAARSATGPAPRRTLVGVINVPFGFDSADLDASAQAALAAIVKELRDNASLTVDLEGSTDTVGAVAYNQRLSERRVDAVRRWLVANGVSRARIVGAAGRGPIVDPAVTDDAKRRVMVKLLISE
jgi:outer membrane protein OmpA-like peptidoglycan-associated protein